MANIKKETHSDIYSNSLSYYLKEITSIPLLTRSEEEQLVIEAQAGSKIAKDKLVRANLKFVVSVAKKYRNQGLSLSDLINEGNIGLLSAINKFDITKGFHFISYAVWWIRQAILKAISEKSRAIRLPLNRANELVKIDKARKKLEIELGDVPTSEDLARETGLDIAVVKHLTDISKGPVSLETPVYESKQSSAYLGDLIKDGKYITPEANTEQSDLRSIINSLLNTLTEKEKQIIEHRFGLNGNDALSLKEIGEKHNLTKERIRQIEKKALHRLRHSSRKDRLEIFMENAG